MILSRMVGVSLKDLWKSSNINGLQASSKALILNFERLHYLTTFRVRADYIIQTILKNYAISSLIC